MVNQTSDKDVCPERAQRVEGSLCVSDEDGHPERPKGVEGPLPSRAPACISIRLPGLAAVGCRLTARLFQPSTSRRFSGARQAHGKKCGRFRHLAGDLIKLRKVLTQGLGYFHLGAFQGADQLQGVDDGLALKVIVRNHESVAGVLVDRTDTRDPRIQLVRGIEIVVTLVGRSVRIVGEPGVIAAAVQADIADGRSHFGGRYDGAADERLVDIAEAHAMLAELFEHVLVLPGSVAQFHDQRVVGEALHNGQEVRGSFARAMEGKRELREDRAKLFGVAQHVKTLADRAFVFGSSRRIMREFLPELRSENERGIGGDSFEPGSRVVGAERLIKGSIDFDSVEEFGEVRGFVEPLGARSGVDIARPVGVGPPGGSDADAVRGARSWNRGLFHHTNAGLVYAPIRQVELA